MLKKVAFIMYPVEDLAHAIDFYKNHFGLTIIVDSEGNAVTLHQLKNK